MKLSDLIELRKQDADLNEALRDEYGFELDIGNRGVRFNNSLWCYEYVVDMLTDLGIYNSIKDTLNRIKEQGAIGGQYIYANCKDRVYKNVRISLPINKFEDWENDLGVVLGINFNKCRFEIEL